MEARKIRRLEEGVVHRIAAGEVVQRPSSALKELLENSLDAGSSSIWVTVRDGGHKMLSVQDDGHGVIQEDLPILCERHTTSKLVAFEDLENMKTLGFRGEALASISYVSHLTITTMTSKDRHASKITYMNGKMDDRGPIPCAGVRGTTVLVEDLFYNVPSRKKALKNTSEEYGRMLEVVSRYAVLKHGVCFHCKKQGSSKPDLHAPGKGSRLDAIRAVYGHSVVQSLVGFDGIIRGTEEKDQDLECDFTGYLSNANYAGKKTTFLLFINGRSVDCSPMKRALETVYSMVFPKASKPFIVLVLTMPPGHVDVNMHPTKREVGFLFQDALIEELCKQVESRLMDANDVRIFKRVTRDAQISTLLGKRPVVVEEDRDQDEESVPCTRPESTTQRARAGGDHKLVRIDARNPIGNLEKYMKIPSRAVVSSDQCDEPSSTPEEIETRQKKVGGLESTRAVRRKRNPGKPSDLTSIQELLSEIDNNCHKGLHEVIKNYSYVGMADGCLGLIQHQTKLYLVDTEALSRDMMYQQVLRRFDRMDRTRLEKPVPLKELMLLALDEEEEAGNWSPEDGPKPEIAELSVKLLEEKSAMLAEYFGIEIETGELRAIPLVIDEYVPDWCNLPSFVLRMVRDVNWNEEKACFHSIARNIAEFYRVSVSGVKESLEGENPSCSLYRTEEEFNWSMQHVMFPAMRDFLLPPMGRERDGSVVQVACLEKLYKIFERC